MNTALISARSTPALTAVAGTKVAPADAGFQGALDTSLARIAPAAGAEVSGAVALTREKTEPTPGSARPEKKRSNEAKAADAASAQDPALIAFAVSVPVQAPDASGGQDANRQDSGEIVLNAAPSSGSDSGVGLASGSERTGRSGHATFAGESHAQAASGVAVGVVPASPAADLAPRAKPVPESPGSRSEAKAAEPQGGTIAAVAGARASDERQPASAIGVSPATGAGGVQPALAAAGASAAGAASPTLSPAAPSVMAASQIASSAFPSGVAALQTSSSAPLAPEPQMAGAGQAAARRASSDRDLQPLFGAAAAKTHSAEHGSKGDAKSGNGGTQGGSAGGGSGTISSGGTTPGGGAVHKELAPAANTAATLVAASVAVAPSVRADAGSTVTGAKADALSGTDLKGATGTSEALPGALPGPVHTARVLESMSGTEMRVGMHSAEFGSISIATSVSGGGLQAQIALDHGALGKALMEHLPGMEQRLGDALGLSARVEVRDGFGGSLPQGGGGSGFLGNGEPAPQGQGRGHGSAYPAPAVQHEPVAAAATEAVYARPGLGERLSVRV